MDLREVSRIGDRDHLQAAGVGSQLRHRYADHQQQDKRGDIGGAADREPLIGQGEEEIEPDCSPIAAIPPPARFPIAATATTTTTSSKATFVFGQLARNGSKIAAAARGARRAAAIAARSLLR